MSIQATEDEFRKLSAMSPEARELAMKHAAAGAGGQVPPAVQRQLMAEAIRMAEEAECAECSSDLDLAATDCAYEFRLQPCRGVTAGVISCLEAIKSPICGGVNREPNLSDVLTVLFCLCNPNPSELLRLARSGELVAAAESWSFDFGSDDLEEGKSLVQKAINDAFPAPPVAPKKKATTPAKGGKARRHTTRR